MSQLIPEKLLSEHPQATLVINQYFNYAPAHFGSQTISSFNDTQQDIKIIHEFNPQIAESLSLLQAIPELRDKVNALVQDIVTANSEKQTNTAPAEKKITLRKISETLKDLKATIDGVQQFKPYVTEVFNQAYSHIQPLLDRFFS